MSNTLNETKTVKIEIVSPVHVGGASEKIWQSAMDFFDYNDCIYFVEIDKLLGVLRDKNVRFDQYSTLLERRDVKGLKDYLFKDLKIDPADLGQRKMVPISRDPGNEIRPMVRNGMGLPYLPGSSLKGALRSVLFTYLYKELRPFTKYQDGQDKSGTQLENELLGEFDESIMRYFRVSDAHFTDADCDIWLIYLFNLYSNNRGGWCSDWKNKFSITTETLKPKTSSSFRLDIAKPLKEIIERKYGKRTALPKNIDRVLKEQPFEHLRNIINQHTKRHIEAEENFFNTYKEAKNTDKILEELALLKKHTDSKTSCLFRLGYGSGFHGITGDWRFGSDHTKTINEPDRKKHRYKSRKVYGDELMGFVQLTF